MNILGALGQGGLQAADIAWNLKCRDEDLAHRKLETEWRKQDMKHRWIDEQRHAMDEKAKQLEQIAQLSALLAGFSLVGMCEVQIPDDLNGNIVVVFGIVTAAAVALPLCAMLTSTMVLVGVMKYDPKTVPNDTYDFRHFWNVHCDADWRFSYQCFNISIGVFLLVLSQIGWIQFSKNSHYRISASSITVIAVLAGLFYYLSTYRKWSSFLATMTQRTYDTINPNTGEMRNPSPSNASSAKQV